jgi:hypothetical protein
VNARIFLGAVLLCLVMAAGIKGWLAPFALLEPTGWVHP